MQTCVSGKIRDQAKKLARENKKSEPSIKEVYWFPDEDEIRLVEIDPLTPQNDHVTPFYFKPDSAVGIDFPCAVALIRPEEKNKLNPPNGWGTWDHAKKI